MLETVKPGIFTRPERWYNLGLAHLAAGNGEKALTVLRMAAKETTGNAPLLVAAGRACAMTGWSWRPEVLLSRVVCSSWAQKWVRSGVQIDY